MYYDKVFMIAIVLLFWYFFPVQCKKVVGPDPKRKGEYFVGSDWSSNVYGGVSQWNGWPY